MPHCPPELPGAAPVPRALRLSVPNELAAIDATRLQVLAFLAVDALEDDTRYRLELVLEEMLMNRLMHAFPAGVSRTTEVVVEVMADALLLSFEDDGVPFDPRIAPVPSPGDPTPGGRGLLLTEKATSDWDYRRVDGRNRFTVRLDRP